MTLYQFKLLSLSEQADATWEKGTLLGFNHKTNFHTVLYRVFDFYVEVLYNTHENKIEGITSFISEDRLQPYLEQIDISSLLS